eukprot:jgi/Mesvir1/28920/Mv25724-RA.1
MLRPLVGMGVRMWKEPSIPGKRGKWQDGLVTQLDEANHSCLVALDRDPRRVYRLSWAHIREKRPSAIWPVDGPEPPLEVEAQEESQAVDANPPCLDDGLSWMDEGELESAASTVTRPVGGQGWTKAQGAPHGGRHPGIDERQA